MGKKIMGLGLVLILLSVAATGCSNISSRFEDKGPEELAKIPENLSVPKAEAEEGQAQDYGSEAEMRLLQPTDFSRLYHGVVLRAGDPDQPYVALTFDDGPDAEYTPQILDVLKEFDVKASFFFIGTNIEAHSDIARRAAQEGHLIASHGYTHANFANLMPEEIRENLRKNRELINKITGKNNRLFRPPYAAINSRAVETISAEGYKIVLWNVDSLDWKSLGQERVVTNVVPAVSSGAIVLQHSSGGATQNLSGTVQALPEIISTLRSQGYTLVTVDRLLELNGQGEVTTWYTVKPGDTFYGIAEELGLTVTDLMRLNEAIDPNYLYVGQKLVASGMPHRAKQEIPADGLYTVSAGDTLWKIGRKFGVDIEVLKGLNPEVNLHNLPVGFRIRLSGTTPLVYYTVRPGDTFWLIAKRTGASVEKLRALNSDVDEGRLIVGSQLKLR